MWKILRVADVREARRLTHLRKPGNVAVKLAPSTRRRAKAERLAMLLRIDHPNSIVRAVQS
jgi:hypothetical protein